MSDKTDPVKPFVPGKGPLVEYLVGFRKLDGTMRDPGEPFVLGAVYYILIVLLLAVVGSWHWWLAVPVFFLLPLTGMVIDGLRTQMWDEAGIKTVYRNPNF